MEKAEPGMAKSGMEWVRVGAGETAGQGWEEARPCREPGGPEVDGEGASPAGWEVTCRLEKGGRARGRSPFQRPSDPKHPRLPLCRGLGLPSRLSPRKLCAMAPTANKLWPQANDIALGQPWIDSLWLLAKS